MDVLPFLAVRLIGKAQLIVAVRLDARRRLLS